MGRHPRVADGAAVEAFLVVAVGHSLKGAITRADGSEGPLGRRGSRVVGDAWDTVDGQRTGAVEGMKRGGGRPGFGWRSAYRMLGSARVGACGEWRSEVVALVMVPVMMSAAWERLFPR